MRVAIMTAGSRGDVAPYTGLGHGLAADGHDVTLVTHARFEPSARAAGLGFHALPVDPREALESPDGQNLHRSRSGVTRLARLIVMVRSLVGELTSGLLDAARDADVLLASGVLAPLALSIGEGLGRPVIGLYLQPLAPTREFAPSVVTTHQLGGYGNRIAAEAVNSAIDAMFSEASRDLRRRLALPPRGVGAVRRTHERAGWPVFHGFSPRVVAPPRDWRPGLRVTGYWWPHDPPGAQLPPDVEKFLSAGPAPVYVGLGSATVPDPAATSRAVVTALRSTGLRGIVQRGWSELDAAGDDMLVVDDLPHSLLFPRTAAVVHHAGAGTTAAGLRAGVPAVPLPLQFDAAFWAARLVALGVAPTSIPFRTLRADTLAEALRQAVGSPAHAERAAAVGRLIRVEDGVRPVADALAALDR